jgi:hypothetical protein
MLFSFCFASSKLVISYAKKTANGPFCFSISSMKLHYSAQEFRQSKNCRFWVSTRSGSGSGSGFSLIRHKTQRFHLCSEAWARAWLKPDLFNKFFKPQKARVQTMKPERAQP